MVESQLISLRVFGSFARGDADELSDNDLLVVTSKTLPSRAIADITSRIVEIVGFVPSISVYSERRLREMYAEGDLFAWHLYKESKPFSHQEPDFLDSLRPSQYTTAASDIASFMEILAGVEQSVCFHYANATYEAGLLYLCARNVAMSASWYTDQGPFFGRRSPFQLEQQVGIEFPLSEGEHRANMESRISGSRGLPLTAASADDVADMSRRVRSWSDQVYKFVQRCERESYGGSA